MPRILRPFFRFRSMFNITFITGAVVNSLKDIFGEEWVFQDSSTSLIVGEQIRVDFSSNGLIEYEFTVSFNSEDCDHGINLCCILSRLLDIY
nr:hypothetical transcript [Hymenolepis microstoma]